MKEVFTLFLMLSCYLLSYAQETAQAPSQYSYTEIDSLMDEAYYNGDYEKELFWIEMGRDKAGNESGNQDSMYLKFSVFLASHYMTGGNYDAALPLLLKTKETIEKTYGTNSILYVEVIHNIGLWYYDLGEYKQALPFFLEAKEMEAKINGRHNKSYPGILTILGLSYQYLENYDVALSYLLEAKEILEKVDRTSEEFVVAVLNLASIYEEIGDYELALPLYLQAKKLEKNILGKNHPEHALTLNNLAFLYQRMNQPDKALSLYLQAKAIYANTFGEEHPTYALILDNLVKVYEDLGNYKAALNACLEAKSIRRKVHGEESLYFAKSLQTEAGLYKSERSYEEALKLYRQAKNIEIMKLGEKHLSLIANWNNIADVYLKIGAKKAARISLEQAMNLSLSSAIPHNFDDNWLGRMQEVSFESKAHIADMLSSLALAYKLSEMEANTASKQSRINTLALSLLDKQRNQTFDEKDKLRLLQQSNDWLKKSLEVLEPGNAVEQAFYIADKNKSVLLYQASKAGTAYYLGDLPDSLIQKDRTLLKQKSKLEAELAEKRTKEEQDSLRGALNEVNADITNLTKEIKANYPKYHELKYVENNAKAKEIQALLAPKTALIEYVIADSILHIFRVDKQEVIWKQEAVPNTVLRKNIKQLHQSLSDYSQLKNNFKQYTDLAHWFYQKLLLPVLKEGDENLILVTDGTLGHLPFESFLTAPAQENNFKQLPYLLKDYNISYNYSATLWKENKGTTQSSNNGKILAMAANYSKKLDPTVLRSRLPTTRNLRDALNPLPAARAEVETLKQLYGGYFAFDSLATEKVLKEKAGDYAIIHLAMHGLLDEKRPMLSSLALTEDGDSLHDNFWQAHEISKAELNADLVVLSACETGYGRFETGNGIASLARAFMYAGVPSLVVSLWQVNDQPTSIIMQNFYANLAKGMDKAEALRQAKLSYIDNVENELAAHPAFWSPFILIGDESPVQLQKKGGAGWTGWIIGGGVGVLALLGLGLSRRKRAA